jgi:hypothetical protein
VTTNNAAFNRCYPPCTGTGGGACRTGYACADPDTNTSNANNICIPLCTADSECGGSGTGYGCNPWSKTCTNKNKNLGKYGAACTAGSQCETGACLTGSNWPNGYCAGLCRGDLKSCGAGGTCDFVASFGDNIGTCFEACTNSSVCRTPDNYGCWTFTGTTTSICACLGLNQSCTFDSDCCSGSCDFFFGTCF